MPWLPEKASCSVLPTVGTQTPDSVFTVTVTVTCLPAVAPMTREPMHWNVPGPAPREVELETVYVYPSYPSSVAIRIRVPAGAPCTVNRVCVLLSVRLSRNPWRGLG